MSVFDLLKNHSDDSATAIPAISAIDGRKTGGTVATIATIAVATPRNEKSEIPSIEPKKGSLPSHVEWDSPLFGRLEGGPVLEMSETHFSLIHPLTGEIVELSNEWLVSMEERSAIMEFDGGIPREEADRKAQGMMFDQFRQGGDEDGYV